MSLSSSRLVVVQTARQHFGTLHVGPWRVATFFSKRGGLQVIDRYRGRGDPRLHELAEFRRDIQRSSLPASLNCLLPGIKRVTSGEDTYCVLLGPEEEPLGDFPDYKTGDELIDLALMHYLICDCMCEDLHFELDFMCSLGLAPEDSTDREEVQSLAGFHALYKGVLPELLVATGLYEPRFTRF